jgi:Arc/MetJ-type ribon-helix-helix transcriptional regulator
MQIDLTPEQRELVQRAIASGRIRSEEDAVAEALAMWERRERGRVEILMALDEAEADLAAGRYDDYGAGETTRLASDLNCEARAGRQAKRP